MICLTVFYSRQALIGFAFIDNAINPVEIAFIHSVFNIVTTMILLPFSQSLVKLANKIIPDGNDKEQAVWLNESLFRPLGSPCRSVEKRRVK